MNDQKTLVIFVLISIAVLGLGVIFVTKTQPSALNVGDSAKVEVLGAKTHDWGEIDIEGGNVEKTFQIKNIGDSDLEVTNFKTSCMCTETRVNISGKNSPAFGMHTRSGWKGVIKPGETADVSVVFDPMFHGPQSTGPITRLVSFNTNDSNNQKVEFEVSGEVVKQ